MWYVDEGGEIHPVTSEKVCGEVVTRTDSQGYVTGEFDLWRSLDELVRTLFNAGVEKVLVRA